MRLSRYNLPLAWTARANCTTRCGQHPEHSTAFCAGLDNLRASGLNFGFIHTVTQQTWQDMVWMADFASNAGARLLQFHPLEIAGRAEEKLATMCPEEDVMAKAI